jgi:hypothetical protein
MELIAQIALGVIVGGLQLSYWFLLLWSLVNEWSAKDRERHLSEL